MDRRKLNAIVAYISRSVSAAALLLWGVVNVAVLVTQYFRQAGGDEENWLVSFLMCVVFGALPFLLGAWLLFGVISSSTKTKSTLNEE